MPIKSSILFIGDPNRSEFSTVTNWLAQQNATIESHVDSALARIHTGFTPAVIIVAQPWPGHVSSRQIESLRRAAPLARIVSLLGTWLEGELRTGKPWPAVWRTYWHQWLPRFSPHFDRLAEGNETAFSLPVTAGDDERLPRFCSMDARSATSAPASITIAIVSSNRETAESLGDICEKRGWPTIWLKDLTDDVPRNIELILFDCRNLAAAEFDQISNLKSQIGNIPIVVLAGFPRAEQISQLKTLDVTAVISKPFLAAELVWQIEQVIAALPLVA